MTREKVKPLPALAQPPERLQNHYSQIAKGQTLSLQPHCMHISVTSKIQGHTLLAVLSEIAGQGWLLLLVLIEQSRRMARIRKGKKMQ